MRLRVAGYLYVRAHTVSQPIGFSLPLSSTNRVFIGLLPWFLVGLALPFIFGNASIVSVLFGAALCGVLVACAYFFARRYTLRTKLVYLSPSGIEGFGARGVKVAILWSEPMTFVRPKGTKCIEVRSATSAPLILPLSIFEAAEFREALKQLAPPDHQLLRVESNAL